MYEKIIELFEDTIEDEVFNTLSFNFASKELSESTHNLNFLIGVPGTGKTFLLNHTFKDAIFLKALLDKDTIDKNLVKDKLIIIDEAQLLDIKLIEYIRTLTDTKDYHFLLSMHSAEAKEILKKEHFKSRSITITELKPITKEEMIQYINVKLLNNDAKHLISQKEFNKIYKYTNGNFRYVKKFIKTLFQLLEFANQNQLVKYNKINDCLITMTALELGLENG